jgi:tagatose-1,6-bisphosphate aldolase
LKSALARHSKERKPIRSKKNYKAKKEKEKGGNAMALLLFLLADRPFKKRQFLPQKTIEIPSQNFGDKIFVLIVIVFIEQDEVVD